MKLQLTKQERANILKEVLAGSIETDLFKRFFQDEPLYIVFTNGVDYKKEDLPTNGCCLVFNKPLPKDVRCMIK